MTKDNELYHFIRNYYKDKGLPTQEINLIGIRDSSGLKNDLIDDYLGFWDRHGVFLVPGTTEPSVFYTLDKIERNPKGTFHLAEGFHEAIWCYGQHKGYDALVNDWRYCKPTRGWRDVNYNFKRDPQDVEICDYIGINFHRMHATLLAKFIGKHSAGCQVVHDPQVFLQIMEWVFNSEMFAKNQKATFNYQLFTIDEIPEELDIYFK